MPGKGTRSIQTKLQASSKKNIPKKIKLQKKDPVRRLHTSVSVNKVASIALPETFAELQAYSAANAISKTESKPLENKDSNQTFHEAMKKLQKEILEFKGIEQICEPYLLQQVTPLKALITDHAETRVQLFFYLLVAVYDTKVKIFKGETNKQHGEGSKELGTHACHSSLFPNVVIENAENKDNVISLEHTHFAESLNLTFELPHLVNELDCHMEGSLSYPTIYTEKCLEILNKVSSGKLDPKSGMQQFFVNINNFFNYYQEKYLSSASSSAAKKEVWQDEKAGTFGLVNDEKDFNLKDKALYALLGLKTDEIKNLEKKPENIYHFYKNVQQKQILGSSAVDKKHSMRTRKDSHFKKASAPVGEHVKDSPGRTF